MKHRVDDIAHPNRQVAPHAGAWIETCSDVSGSVGGGVAPHAGAWIETDVLDVLTAMSTGRPPRGGVD